MATAFNNAAPTIMYNYQTVIPKPTPRPAFEPGIQQALRSLIFLYDIPPYLDDDDILELLATCGSVERWDRVLNGDQTRRDHGFCVFEKPVSVIKAMRSIPEPRFVSMDGKDINNDQSIVESETNEKSKDESIQDLENEELSRLNTMKVKIDVCTRNYLKKHLKKEFMNHKPDFETRSKLKYIFEPFWGYEEEEKKLELGILGNQNNDDLMESDQESAVEDTSFAEIERFKKRELKRIRDFQLFTMQPKVSTPLFNEDEIDFKQWWKARKPFKDREFDQDMRELEIDEQRKREQIKVEKEQEAIDFLAQLQPVEQVVDSEEDENVAKIMTMQERKEKLQDLLQTIPYLKDELWNYNVKFNVIDAKIMLKIEQYITKKLSQLLGTENVGDLVNYMISNLKKGPFYLMKELELVLDNEAEKFMSVVWRMVCFEAEARVKNLQ